MKEKTSEIIMKPKAVGTPVAIWGRDRGMAASPGRSVSPAPEAAGGRVAADVYSLPCGPVRCCRMWPYLFT